jgi:2-polyprenyl-3-methyl-5-hydroxy-6-metoxy-1,4-benzoquinol methylase
MRSLDLVHKYFDREAERFDVIYEKDKPLHQQIGDAIFRRVIHERYSLVVNAINVSGRSFLDVGCGPGRYGVELARRGAARCVGVDVAAAMIDIAHKEAEAAGVASRCEWAVSDFMSWQSEERFDAIAAMGYYDYLENPQPHLDKMIARCKGQVFCSFPKRWEMRVPLRIARFKIQRGFVRFYSRGEVVELFRRAAGRDDGLRFLSIVDLGRDYITIYNRAAADSVK